MDQELYQRVASFVRTKLWEPQDGLYPETRLEQDVGIAGLDGKDFIEAFAEEFSVDLEGFDWVEYFGPEGVGCLPLYPFQWLYLKLFDPEVFDHHGLPAITLRDLAKWAERGKWSPTEKS